MKGKVFKQQERIGFDVQAESLALDGSTIVCENIRKKEYICTGKEVDMVYRSL